MRRGLFVTGTDTNVGKTIVSAALMHRFRRAAPGMRYWKPIQTGIEQDDDTATVRRLGGCDEAEVWDEGVRLPRPVSPHLASILARTPISIEPLVEMWTREPAKGAWIIEGAGGLLVPLDEEALMVDLIFAIGLPSLLVARSGLGTINHTLLSIEALRKRALPLAGVIMVGEPNRDNLEAIEHYGGVRVIGELPHLPALSADTLADAALALDPSNQLLPYLG
jgi:dethiobiotin synthetase